MFLRKSFAEAVQALAPPTNSGAESPVVTGPPIPTVVQHAAASCRRTIVFLLPSALVLILALCFWEGMRATDDLGYTRIAEFLLRPGQVVASVGGHHVGRL